MRDNVLVRWENLPKNRIYKARYFKTKLIIRSEYLQIEDQPRERYVSNYDLKIDPDNIKKIGFNQITPFKLDSLSSSESSVCNSFMNPPSSSDDNSNIFKKLEKEVQFIEKGIVDTLIENISLSQTTTTTDSSQISVKELKILQDLENKNEIQKDFELSMMTDKNVIFVSFELPIEILISTDSEGIIKQIGRFGIRYSKNPVQISLYQGMKQFFPNFLWVSVLSFDLFENIDQIEMNQLIELLLIEFQIHPIILQKRETNIIIDSYTNHFLSQEQIWDNYIFTNKIFVEEIVKLIKKPQSVIFVQGYQFFLFPSYLRQNLPQEYYHLIYLMSCNYLKMSVYKRLINNPIILYSLLFSDIIVFNAHKFAIYFIEKCTDIDLFYDFLKDGTQIILSGGKKVIIQVSNTGLNFDFFQQFTTKKPIYQKIILSIDQSCPNSGLEQKFDAFNQFNASNNWEYKLLQITYQLNKLEFPSYFRNFEDEYRYERKIHDLADVYNSRSRTQGIEIKQMKNLSIQNIIGYMEISPIFVCTTYKQISNYLFLELYLSINSHGRLLAKQFQYFLNSFTNIQIINSFDKKNIVDALQNSIDTQISQDFFKFQFYNQKLFNYLQIQQWIFKIFESIFLKEQRSLNKLPIVSNEYCQTLSYYKLSECLGRFRNIPITKYKDIYKKSQNNVFIFDYNIFLKDPIPIFLDTIQKICAIPQNTVFIVSELAKEFIDQKFNKIQDIIILAKNGLLVKKVGLKDQFFQTNYQNIVWKPAVRNLIQLFTDKTPGTYALETEFSISWIFGTSNKQFIDLQKREFMKLLINIIRNIPSLEIYENVSSIIVQTAILNKRMISALSLKSVQDLKGQISFMMCVQYQQTDILLKLKEQIYFNQINIREETYLLAALCPLETFEWAYQLDEVSELEEMLSNFQDKIN